MSMNSNSVMVGRLSCKKSRKLYAARLSFRSALGPGRLMGSMARARPGASAAAVEARRKSRRDSDIGRLRASWGMVRPVYSNACPLPRLSELASRERERPEWLVPRTALRPRLPQWFVRGGTAGRDFAELF